jgi:phosphatidylserine decarboxylase
LEGRRNPFVAREGVPFLAIAAVAFLLALRYLDIAVAFALALLFFVLVLIFRDPRRGIPASPLGVVSPVDGQVVDVDLADKGVLQGEAHRVRIRIDSFGTYTARAPVEGKIMDLRSINGDKVVDYETNALWLQTDEGDDVVLQFRGFRFGLAPKSFVRFGERVGQGQRCAYLRLTRFAEVHLPIESTVLVKPGQVVVAGADLIGKVPHP